jgi:hypothetical protein
MIVWRDSDQWGRRGMVSWVEVESRGVDGVWDACLRLPVCSEGGYRRTCR